MKRLIFWMEDHRLLTVPALLSIIGLVNGCSEECTPKPSTTPPKIAVPESIKNNAALYVLDKTAEEIHKDIETCQSNYSGDTKSSILTRLHTRLEEVYKQRQLIADEIAHTPPKTPEQIGLDILDAGIARVEEEIKVLRLSGTPTHKSYVVHVVDESNPRQTIASRKMDVPIPTTDRERENQLYDQLLSLHQAKIDLAKNIKPQDAVAARYDPERLEREYNALVRRNQEGNLARQTTKPNK